MAEQAKIEAQARIDDYRAAAGVFPALRRVLEEYNGKIFNCRLERSLKETFGESGHIYVKKDDRRIYIEFSASGNYRSFRTLLNISISDALPDGKRIDAAAMINAARETRAELLRKAYTLEEVGERAEEIKQQIAGLEKAICAIVDPLPYEARDLYDIRPHRVRYY